MLRTDSEHGAARTGMNYSRTKLPSQRNRINDVLINSAFCPFNGLNGKGVATNPSQNMGQGIMSKLAIGKSKLSVTGMMFSHSSMGSEKLESSFPIILVGKQVMSNSTLSIVHVSHNGKYSTDKTDFLN